MPIPQRRRRDREPVREVSNTAPGAIAAADETPGRAAGSNRQPKHEDIARRAYQLFETRGAAHGHDWDDWLQAEGELQQERS